MKRDKLYKISYKSPSGLMQHLNNLTYIDGCWEPKQKEADKIRELEHRLAEVYHLRNLIWEIEMGEGHAYGAYLNMIQDLYPDALKFFEIEEEK